MPRGYESVKCPMGDCTEDLYIEHHSSRPVFTDDTAADLADPAGAYTATWSIGCAAGHVVLVPVDHAGDTEVFGAEHDTSPAGDPDETCVHDDLGRLHRLAGVVPGEG